MSEKTPDKRDEFQAFKSLTRRLVAVPRKEISAKRAKRRARARKPQ